MYHVFEYEYETSEFRGSASTLKEAYDLVQGDTAELYENTAQNLTLRHVADFFEESHAIDGDYQRAHRQRGWFFLEEKRIEVIDEYNERWVDHKPIVDALLGEGFNGTGLYTPGHWERE